MKYLRYWAEFKDVEGSTYRIEILQEAETAYTPGEVILSSDPVTIEWNEVTKLEPVMSSAATVKLISMSDRQFVDLYTVEPCAIRLDIYRNDSLYWSGTLDTELFEEPYYALDRYVTEITFSDFAVLDRLTWVNTGLATLSEVLSTCIDAAEIGYTRIEKKISTSVSGSSTPLLDDCSISLENFYDEDGTAWTMREVLDEVLRPFALQLRQKNGAIHICDLNSLAAEPGVEVEWRASDSMLGVEPVYNKAVVTYSPYSKAMLFDGEFDSEEIIPNPNASGVTTLLSPLPGTDYNGFNTYLSAAYGSDTNVQGLTVAAGSRLFRIDPVNNGAEASGVAWGARAALDTWIGNALPSQTEYDPYSGGIMMQTPRIPIQKGSKNNNIRISLDVLIDPRKNPFESAEKDNDNNKTEWDVFEKSAAFCLIPCLVRLYGVDGKTYEYTNESLYGFSYDDRHGFNSQYEANKGEWKESDYTNNPCWLAYYDEGDRKDKTGLGGWQTNKQSIGFWLGNKIPRNITLNINGEKIPMPGVSGELQVFVYAGAWITGGGLSGMPIDENVFNSIRWALYKDLRVDVVTYSGSDIKVEDVEISAWINRAAEEELPIDIYIGSADTRIPLARGAILKSKDMAAITLFSRAAVADSLERLLIGTVYSNYAMRHSTLSGTIKLLEEDEVLYDKFAVNRRFRLLSSVENLEQATSQIKMAEFSEDNYEGVEYEV